MPFTWLWFWRIRVRTYTQNHYGFSTHLGQNDPFRKFQYKIANFVVENLSDQLRLRNPPPIEPMHGWLETQVEYALFEWSHELCSHCPFIQNWFPFYTSTHCQVSFICSRPGSVLWKTSPASIFVFIISSLLRSWKLLSRTLFQPSPLTVLSRGSLRLQYH